MYTTQIYGRFKGMFCYWDHEHQTVKIVEVERPRETMTSLLDGLLQSLRCFFKFWTQKSDSFGHDTFFFFFGRATYHNISLLYSNYIEIFPSYIPIFQTFHQPFTNFPALRPALRARPHGQIRWNRGCTLSMTFPAFLLRLISWGITTRHFAMFFWVQGTFSVNSSIDHDKGMFLVANSMQKQQ